MLRLQPEQAFARPFCFYNGKDTRNAASGIYSLTGKRREEDKNYMLIKVQVTILAIQHSLHGNRFGSQG